MMNKPLADSLAKKLREGITHPGDDKRKPWGVVLPFFRTMGQTEEQIKLADEFAQTLAEAIINEISQDYELVGKDEAKQMRQAMTVGDTNARNVTVHCRRCDQRHTNPLMVLRVGYQTEVTVDGEQLLKGLSQRAIKCPHEGKVR